MARDGAGQAQLPVVTVDESAPAIRPGDDRHRSEAAAQRELDVVRACV
jgi:hypothetical protein